MPPMRINPSVTGGQMDPTVVQSMERNKELANQRNIAAMQANAQIASAQAGLTGEAMRAQTSQQVAEKNVTAEKEIAAANLGMQKEQEANAIRRQATEQQFQTDFQRAVQDHQTKRDNLLHSWDQAKRSGNLELLNQARQDYNNFQVEDRKFKMWQVSMGAKMALSMVERQQKTGDEGTAMMAALNKAQDDFDRDTKARDIITQRTSDALKADTRIININDYSDIPEVGVDDLLGRIKPGINLRILTTPEKIDGLKIGDADPLQSGDLLNLMTTLESSRKTLTELRDASGDNKAKVDSYNSVLSQILEAEINLESKLQKHPDMSVRNMYAKNSGVLHGYGMPALFNAFENTPLKGNIPGMKQMMTQIMGMFQPDAFTSGTPSRFVGGHPVDFSSLASGEDIDWYNVLSQTGGY